MRRAACCATEVGFRAGLSWGQRPSRLVDERTEDVLPAKHPVGEKVEPGVLLRGDEALQVAVELRVDLLPGGSTRPRRGDAQARGPSQEVVAALGRSGARRTREGGKGMPP